jgi:hypothetical protein
MSNYCVNKNAQANGDHEVHEAGCTYWPRDRVDLGDFASCTGAVTAARKHYTQVNGCKTCSRACHTQ